MKVTSSPLCAALLGAVIQGTFSQTPEANATAPSPVIPSQANASINILWCDAPSRGVNNWFYQDFSRGPFGCAAVEDSKKWTMLNSYRAGGKQNVHWRYTNRVDDPTCLTNWDYYEEDGKTLKGRIARTTTMGDTRSWCALPIYRQGGVKGKQWDYCDCYRIP